LPIAGTDTAGEAEDTADIPAIIPLVIIIMAIIAIIIPDIGTAAIAILMDGKRPPSVLGRLWWEAPSLTAIRVSVRSWLSAIRIMRLPRRHAGIMIMILRSVTSRQPGYGFQVIMNGSLKAITGVSLGTGENKRADKIDIQ